jgi:hypothetical protein
VNRPFAKRTTASGGTRIVLSQGMLEGRFSAGKIWYDDKIAMAPCWPGPHVKGDTPVKYTADVYQSYGSFFAKAVEIAKDKVGLYNQLLSPPMREKTGSAGFRKFLEFVIYVLRTLGWLVYVTVVGLVALGAYAYFGGMGTLIATNPVLAAIMAAIGGQAVYLVWKHREFLAAQKRVGDVYREKFDVANREHSGAKRYAAVDALMRACVVSLCVEVYQINNDSAQAKIGAEI